jgi:Ca2+-transporting ATPase
MPSGMVKSKMKPMCAFHSDGNKWIVFVKGAPAKMIERLHEKYKERIPEWLELNRKWASEGLRVLFFAHRKLEEKPAKVDESLETNLDFLGITAMIDPPRAEVIDAIQQCKTAGITVMITGDQALTAKAIAERLHIIDDGTGEVKTGSDLEKTSEEEFVQKVRNIYVYARVTPEQKLRIVKALQRNGEFVSMTGDGVNDAPALKQADIGVAMGITGTDVTKEAADMILLDDNFTTIVKAVREGRRIYENIRKFILYVLSCNLCEILLIFFAPILGFAIPLLPIHILWINLVTDGLPGIALVSEPAEKDIMNHPPRPPKENLFAGGFSQKIILSAIVMTLACFTVLWWADSHSYDVRTQQSMVFTTLCFVQLANALSSRSFYHSLFSSGAFYNRIMWGAIILTVILQLSIVYIPFLQVIFKTAFLDLTAMTLVVMATLGSLLAIELIKYSTRRIIAARN